MRKYNAFWWILGLTALSHPGINFIFYTAYIEITSNPTESSQVIKFALGNPFAFPDVWHTVAYFSSWFVFIPAVMVIMFITNEYTFKTHRQNIIDGWGRSQFITAKMLDVLIITLIITVLNAATTLVAGFMNHTRLIRDTWGSVHFTGLFFLQTFAQLSIAFLIGFLVRKAFIALGIFIFYFLIFENIAVALGRRYADDIGRFLPLEMADRMIPVPPFLGKFDTPENYKKALDAIPQFTLMTIGLTSLVWLLCYWLHKRRDLK